MELALTALSLADAADPLPPLQVQHVKWMVSWLNKGHQPAPLDADRGSKAALSARVTPSGGSDSTWNYSPAILTTAPPAGT